MKARVSRAGQRGKSIERYGEACHSPSITPNHRVSYRPADKAILSTLYVADQISLAAFATSSTQPSTGDQHCFASRPEQY
jgi:hypothetical protein